MIEILYDCKDFVVCVKPTGLISEMTDTNIPSLPRTLTEEQGYSALYTVHRLDKEVSGVMVYAKTPQSAAEISRQISEKLFDKQYIVEVLGIPEEDRVTLNDLLYYDRQRNKTYTVKRKRKGIKEASLEYQLIEKRENTHTSILQIKLFTGRTHQIRVQLASRKLFICGDRKYGSADNIKPLRLHSFRLSFYDTQSGERLSFTSLPDWYGDKDKIVNM